MKLKKLCTVLLFLIILLSGCNIAESSISFSKQAFEKLNENDKLKVERATPVQLIELYVDGINHNNPYLSIAVLSEQNDINTYYTNANLEDIVEELFKGRSIKNLKIIENKDKNSKELDPSNHFHLIISYDLEMLSSTQPPGSGYYYYFVDCIKEENMWKINTFATSP